MDEDDNKKVDEDAKFDMKGKRKKVGTKGL